MLHFVFALLHCCDNFVSLLVCGTEWNVQILR